MEIGINFKNEFVYAVANFPYNEGHYPNPENKDSYQIVETSGKHYGYYVKAGESEIVEIPGMGSLLIQFLGESRLDDYHSKEDAAAFDNYKCSTLIRYNSLELYWRFDYTGNPQIEFTLNRYGTLELNRVNLGEVRTISIPQIILPELT